MIFESDKGNYYFATNFGISLRVRARATAVITKLKIRSIKISCSALSPRARLFEQPPRSRSFWYNYFSRRYMRESCRLFLERGNNSRFALNFRSSGDSGFFLMIDISKQERRLALAHTPLVHTCGTTVL